MEQYLVKFIENNIELIENRDFEQLYLTLKLDRRCEFTETMMSIDINPLEYLTFVPQSYLRGSSTITECRVPEGITCIGNNAFIECAALTKVILPKSLKEIKPYAFSRSGITELKLPDSLSNLDVGALSRSMITSIDFPDTLNHISQNCALMCSKLKYVKLGKNTETIASKAFWGCAQLRNVELNEGLKNIEEFAFTNCISLDNIYIPSSVTRIDKTVFMYNSNIVIQCEQESFAHEYAERFDIQYQLV